MWGGVLIGVLTVALIASVESLLSAVAVDKMGQDKMGQGGKSNFDRERSARVRRTPCPGCWVACRSPA